MHGSTTTNRTEWLVENPRDRSVLVLVPRGRFLAGGPHHYESRCPAFPLELPAYHLAIHPVTNAQYKHFIDATGHDAPRCWRAGMPGELLWDGRDPPRGLEEHPVVGVRWEDARSYCAWAGLRLPTELEWERAARGDRGRLYPWGNTWDATRCQNDVRRKEETTANVWAHPESCSVWGHYQMAGNVWEWCEDLYEPGAYVRYRRGDTSPPATGRHRVVRGGSWFNVKRESFLTTYRFHASPTDADRQYGFRVARDARGT